MSLDLAPSPTVPTADPAVIDGLAPHQPQRIGHVEAERLELAALDADGKVVAVGASCVCGFARMPSALVAADKLHQLATTADEEMG